MKLNDESGNAKFALCAIILFVNHGLRDYLITSIPSIVIQRNETDLQRIVLYEPLEVDRAGKSISYNPYTDFCELQLSVKEGWTSAYVGLALSIIHWTWVIPIVASPFLIKRIPTNLLLTGSLGIAGIVALCSEVVATRGPGWFVVLRGFQGFFQGWCYPIVYFILHNVPSSAFVVPFFIIFLAPCIGSSTAAMMGGASNPFTGAYAFGSLSILIACLSFFVSLRENNALVKPSNAWRETLTSLPTWACISVEIGGVWSLHTFLIGLSFTNSFRFCRNDLAWTVFVVILVGGVTTRIVAVAAMGLMRRHFLSALNRRRFVITCGGFIIIVALIVNGTVGTDVEWALFGVCTAGVCLGASFCLVGVRLNLHDIGPSFPTLFLHLGGIGASVGAGAGSLLFPILAKVLDESSSDLSVDGPWCTAWLVPISIMTASCVAHLFLLSVNPLPHQTVLLEKREASIHLGNGIVPVAPAIQQECDTNKQEFDLKSFKSLKSALSFKSAQSFKSAASRSRTRTISFKTVDGEIDADLRTITDSDTDECRSVVQEQDDDNQDMKSIKSGATSFKSTGEGPSENGMQREVILDVPQLDRTSAWLTTHHSVNGKIPHETTAGKSKEKMTVEKNILYAIQW